MSKGKLAKFADMASYPHVFECPFKVMDNQDSKVTAPSLQGRAGGESVASFPMRGRWRQDFFHNNNPIVLELGCGRGEYAVGLARRYPDRNFIGVDIKGARMWTGATQSLREGLKNVAFLRTNIEIIDRFFAPGEVQEIWLTFSDPQMKKATKRLTSTYFLNRYRHFLEDGGIVHLKTDSNFLFTYTRYVTEVNRLPVEVCTDDLYRLTPLPLPCREGSSHLSAADEDGHLSNNEKNCNLSGSGNAIEPTKVYTPLPTREGQGGESAFDLSIQTYYEQQWLARGIAIKYLRFRLPHEGTLVEPDVEIPLDDYRSYNRDKRSSLLVSK